MSTKADQSTSEENKSASPNMVGGAKPVEVRTSGIPNKPADGHDATSNDVVFNKR